MQNFGFSRNASSSTVNSEVAHSQQQQCHFQNGNELKEDEANPEQNKIHRRTRNERREGGCHHGGGAGGGELAAQ